MRQVSTLLLAMPCKSASFVRSLLGSSTLERFVLVLYLHMPLPAAKEEDYRVVG